MHPLGTFLKRRSQQKIEPTLPKSRINRQPSSNARTIYKELKSPSDQLKQFTKKQLNTVANLSTQKSISNMHSDQYYNMKQSRFDDDHHNTESIAQLLQTKKNSLVQTVRQQIVQRKETINLSSLSNYINRSSNNESLQSQLVTKLDSDKKQQQDFQQNKQGQNYDDYVLGDKIEESDQEESDKPQEKIKKYASQHKIITLKGYTPQNQSQLRMEQLRVINERKRLLNIQEDRQIIAYLQQYRNNKRNILNQTKTKHQTARIMALNNQQSRQKKIEKSLSLPALKPKQEIYIIPKESHYDYENKRNILAKNFTKQNDLVNNKKQFLSYGKLGFGRKKVRTICEQQIRNQQMGTLQQIKGKLRAKGIPFDANKLKKGLINMKHEPQYKNIVQYPSLTLPSNPMYKKFPL